MKFKKLSKSNPETIRILNENGFDIDLDFRINNDNVEKINVKVKNINHNKYRYNIIDGFICCDVIKNSDVYFINLNFKKIKPNETIEVEKSISIESQTSKCKLKLKTGTIIFSKIIIYEPNEIIKPCYLDIFEITATPETKDGSIIIGG